MNVWMADERVVQAEVDAFEAERAERRGDLAGARERHHAAADAFAKVALSVPPSYPNTRSDLAIAAVASYGRAGDFGRAVELSRRMLAESDALTEHGLHELSQLMRAYAALLAPVPSSDHPQPLPERLRHRGSPCYPHRIATGGLFRPRAAEARP